MFENVGEMVILFWQTLVALPLTWRQRQNRAPTSQEHCVTQPSGQKVRPPVRLPHVLFKP